MEAEILAKAWLKEHRKDTAIFVAQIAEDDLAVLIVWRRSEELVGIGYCQHFPNEVSARGAVKTQARRYVGGKPDVVLFDLRPKVVDWLDTPAVAECG